MTPWANLNGELYELGEVECPECGLPVVGYYRNGLVLKVDACGQCGHQIAEPICPLCGQTVHPEQPQIRRVLIADETTMPPEAVRETLTHQRPMFEAAHFECVAARAVTARARRGRGP